MYVLSTIKGIITTSPSLQNLLEKQYKPENNSKVSLEMTGGFRASSQMLNSQVRGK